jgi:hypothetical protein
MTAAAALGTPDRPFDRTAILARLAADAEYLRPQLFAVYGIFKAVPGLVPERPFMGWGIDFGEEWGVIFWNPVDHTTQLSNSAEQVLRAHSRTGEAHLVWLD